MPDILARVQYLRRLRHQINNELATLWAIAEREGLDMSEENGNGPGADIALKVGGQEINVKNVKSINTILTFMTTLGVGILAYAFYVHGQDTRDTSKLFIEAIKTQTMAVKEQTTVQREQNCLMRFDQKDRPANAEFCKQVTR